MPTNLSFPIGSQNGDLQCTTVNITDDEVVEGQESFYIGLTTNDSRIEIFALRGQRTLSRFCINDNDSKLFVWYTLNFDMISYDIIIITHVEIIPKMKE